MSDLAATGWEIIRFTKGKLSMNNETKLLSAMRDYFRDTAGAERVSRPAVSNVPGFSYAQRITSAWSDATLAMTESCNRDWNDIKSGTYDFGGLMRTWAGAYESLSDVFVEALKGPSFRSRPEWLHIQFERAPKPNKRAPQAPTRGTPDALSGVANLDQRYGQDAILETTTFERLGAGNSGDDLDLFKAVSWKDSLRRDTIRAELDQAKVQELAPGDYIGFILEQGVTAAPPLVIVMLRVTALS